ncbi:MAG: VUT family protein, partial [Devosiaceae bacterium]|nr:VUT family protein [Devosiaceae bacterium]
MLTRILSVKFLPFIGAMTFIVVLSNFLVQFPVEAHLGNLNFADLLTWGAFTYPIAFLITDLTNQRLGAQGARRVVLVGFVIAVILSVWLATPRIAIASGTAFLLAQMLDVAIFERLRATAWWRGPLISSVFGSILDTALFFTLAFATPFAFLGQVDGFVGELSP